MHYHRAPCLIAWLIIASTACDDPQAPSCAGDKAASVAISSTDVRPLEFAGDTLRLRAVALSECGDTLHNASFLWSSANSAIVTVSGGLVTARGAGSTVVRAVTGGAGDAVSVTVTLPRAGSFTTIGLGLAPTTGTTELWLHGDYAYTGTGNGRLYVWRISETAAPTLVDSIFVSGSIGDVMTSPDGRLGFLALQSFGRGVAILDLANPAKPVIQAMYSTNLERGVHTLWFERINNRDYVFAVENGSTVEGGLHIIDVTPGIAPVEVAHFYAGSSFAHDVYVRDGLAFLSHWDAGLIILDVGNGIRGGTPTAPVEVARLTSGLRSVHNVWYWPARKMAFVGEERSSGRLQVIDLADLTRPRLVGFRQIDNAVPHNFWMDESAGLLYAAWYAQGVRVFDVNGSVTGDIAGREIAFTIPTGPRGAASIWGPQLHRGVVYAADISNGLWAFRFQRDGS